MQKGVTESQGDNPSKSQKESKAKTPPNPKQITPNPKPKSQKLSADIELYKSKTIHKSQTPSQNLSLLSLPLSPSKLSFPLSKSKSE